MENTLQIPVVLGTGRFDRESEKVAKWITETLNSRNEVSAELVDVAEMGYSVTVPPWGKGGVNEKATSWKEVATKADGYILVVPEYNRGYPGELKLALDSLYKEYENKPVLVCGVSGGGFGGSRIVEHIQPVLSELKMVFVTPSMYVSKVADDFTEDGPVNDSFVTFADKSFDSLIRYALVLRDNRDALKRP